MIVIDNISYSSSPCGVYKITNKINGKFYVGSTNSMYNRLKEHKSKLLRKIHPCTHLQNAWNKYGEENFEFKIVSRCPPEYRLKLEQWFLNNTNPSYNISTIASHPSFKQTKESINKMIETRKQKGITNAVPIYAYDQEGVFIKKFDKIEDAANEVGINYTTIYRSIRIGSYVRPNRKGNLYYTFRKNMCIVKPFILPISKQRYKTTRKRPIYKKDKVTDVIIESYKNLDDCFEKTGISKKTMAVRISTDSNKRTPYYFTYNA